MVCAFGLMFATSASAQDVTVSGTVVDAVDGEPLPGVTVMIQGTSQGTATDPNGTYEIEAPSDGVLTFSYVGYIQQEIAIEGRTTIDVELEADVSELDEVVVTGYGGMQTKRELTGSITSVSSDDIENMPVQSTGSLLQGRAAGVQVATTSGTPGGGFDINIRGQGSINAETQPLYIVDGVQMSFSNQNNTNDNTPLNAIPPENIQSIEVLKDAAAASIYGAQAANGVVIITTKRGVEGTTQVSASIERGVTQQINSVEYFNRDQFIQYFQEAIAYDNFGTTTGFDESTRTAIDNFFRQNYLPLWGYDASTPYNEVANTDWYDFISREGVSQNYNVTVSGGNEASQYRISANYEDTEGWIDGNDYSNYSLNGNFDQQITDKFSTQMNINLSSQEFIGPCQDGFFINCPVSQASFSSPLTRPYNDDGSYSRNFPIIGQANNPAIVKNEQVRSTDVLQIIGSLSGTYQFTDWLSLRTQASMDYRKEDERDFRNPIAAPGDGGSLTEITAPTSNFQISSVLNFDRTLYEDHNVSGLVGFEYRRDFTKQFATRGIGFPNELFTQLNSTATPTTAAGFTDEFRQTGYFANLKYNFNQKYFVSLTGRYDGSSRFGENNRFGFFPAASVGWNINEEDFFNADFVDLLKLRVSYGETGNSEIGRYAARGLYGTSGSYLGGTGLRPSQLANQNLTWEESSQINLGVDYNLFGDRITGAIDVYRKDNTGLLLNQPLPNDSGFGSITRNVGEVRNDGVEFEIRTMNISTRDFSWSTNFNIAVNRNEVMKLTEGQDALNPNGLQPVAVGHSIEAWQVIPYGGVNPADGRPMWKDADGNLTYNPDPVDDLRFYDGAEEDLIGGFGTNLQYKGLSLRAFFQYSFGQTALPEHVVVWGINQTGGSLTNGIDRRLEEAWKEPGDMAQFPAPTTAFTYPNSEAGYFTTATDKFYDASYIRLKNVTLSYSLPPSVTDAANIGNVRLYVTGLNLVTWTNYLGYDPEVAGDGITQASVPVGRTVNAGIEVQF